MPSSEDIEENPAPSVVDVYPQLYEHLRNLPPHLVEHVGGTALRLSHIDMHPTTEVEDYGSISEQPDFSARITDPEFDASLVEVQAVEAAHAGKEKLGKVLHHSSSLLSKAHETLVAEGHEFRAENAAGESDEQRTERETSERHQLLRAAEELATKEAVAAKESGDAEKAVKALEALMVLQHMRSGKSYDDAESRATYRQLVCAGLANEVVSAAQESQKIKVDGSSKHVADTVDDSIHLLRMATGKNIDYDYLITGDLAPENVGHLGPDGVLDVLAVVSAKSDMPEIVRRQCLEKLRHFDIYKPLHKYISEGGSLQELSALYQLGERCLAGHLAAGKESAYRDIGFVDGFTKLLESDNPQGMYRAAETLGIDIYRVKALFCVKEESDRSGRETKFNEQAAQDFEELIARFPEYRDVIIDKLFPSNGNARLDFGALHRTIESLRSIGLSSPNIVECLILNSNRESTLEACTQVVEYMKTHDMTEQQLTEALASRGSLSGLVLQLASSEEQNPADQIECALIESSIIGLYTARLEKLEYPLSRETIMAMRYEISELSLMEQRLARLGLPPELAAGIFKSWATYSELAKFAYDVGEFADLPELKESDLKYIAREQAKTLIYQMQAIESFRQEFGAEDMRAVIDIFGIYNFKRHEAKKLKDQLDRWRRGEPIKTVVAEARADWNNYNGKAVNFENESDSEGLFYFEANSAFELSKMAIVIGRYERSHGREPDTHRFIVHAHGNRTGMLLGVNGERVTVAAYEAAARARKKIGQSELSDYRRYLGPNFSVILQSCSTAGEGVGASLATTMARAHKTKVRASKVTIHSLTIRADGSVEFGVDKEDSDHAGGVLLDGRET